MSDVQKLGVSQLLRDLVVEYRQTRGHHGDCVGADADFHILCRKWAMEMTIHPPIDETHRAFCKVDEFDEMRAPLKHMQRNKQIVAAADVMIATPLDLEEKTVGGTWKTIGFTRKASKPLAIVWRDGRVTLERWPAAFDHWHARP